MTSNPLKGEVKINLGGTEYVARLSIDSIIRLEEREGESLIKMASNLSDADMGIGRIVSILYMALRGGMHKDFSEHDIKAIVGSGGIASAMKACGEILTASLMPEGADEGNVEAE